MIAAERALAEAHDATAADKAQYAVALAKTSLKAARGRPGGGRGQDRGRHGPICAAASPRRGEPRPRRRPPRSQARTCSRPRRPCCEPRWHDHEAVSTGPNQPGKAKANPAEQDASDMLSKAREAARAARKATSDDSPSYSPLTPVYPSTSTGRRLALARWITDPGNPLTARVAVNQIWMRHFGSPLVPSVFDFGRNGTPPAIPALLDWLAVRLRDEGWRMKPIHRLIVTSTAYRMQSTSGGPNDPNLTRDPANTYYWRMNPRRMEAEAVRDNVLHVAGSLDQTMGGPDLDPEAGLKTPRRSLYFRHAKEKRVTFLRLFDSPNVCPATGGPRASMPQQALALANSSLCLEQARLLARRLGNSCHANPRRPTTAHS